MASRPRRSAATRASESISVHAKWADASDKRERNIMASRRSGRTSGASALRDSPSSPSDSHISVNVKTLSSAGGKTRQTTQAGSRRSERFEGGEIVTGTRNRGGRKNYVIDSSPDEDDEDDEDDDEEEPEIDDAEDDVDEDEDDEDEDDVDADGREIEANAEEEDMDAEGEDADGDVSMDTFAISAAPTIRVSQPYTSRSAVRAGPSKIVVEEPDDDDEELSDLGESDACDQTLGLGDEIMACEDADEDAEGEEIEVAREDAGEPGSDEDGSRAGTPDLAKMTKRQRARFEDEPQEYMKLSDEVQVKKHFTAEELSMRRQEMARRRRNLSEKRTEEVKMETINKLLKKQAPKTSRRGGAATAAGYGRGPTPDEEEQKTSPIFIRWVNRKNGSRVSVPQEILLTPAGMAFTKSSDLDMTPQPPVSNASTETLPAALTPPLLLDALAPPKYN